MKFDESLRSAIISDEDMKKAGLTPEEHERALEMREVQITYLQLLDAMSYPVDQNGTTHDLNHMNATVMAIAWTLALQGARFTGPKYIKKRFPDTPIPGMYEDAHTWVDLRAADRASEDLKPEHHSDDPMLPPDTRRLAAIRDGDEPPETPDIWHTRPKIKYIDEPRPADD